jgi:hypothetical protein
MTLALSRSNGTVGGPRRSAVDANPGRIEVVST